MNTLALQTALNHVDDLLTATLKCSKSSEEVSASETQAAIDAFVTAQQRLEAVEEWKTGSPSVGQIANDVSKAVHFIPAAIHHEINDCEEMMGRSPDQIIRERLAPAINSIPAHEPEIITELRCTLADLGNPDQPNHDVDDVVCWEAIFSPENLVEEAMEAGLLETGTHFEQKLIETFGAWSSNDDLIRRIEAQCL